MKPVELVNGTGPPLSSCLIDTIETEPPQKNKSNGTTAPTESGDLESGLD